MADDLGPFRALVRNAAAADAPPPVSPAHGLRINTRVGLVLPRVPADARREYEYQLGERSAIMEFDGGLTRAEAEEFAREELGCLEFWFFISATSDGLRKAA